VLISILIERYQIAGKLYPKSSVPVRSNPISAKCPVNDCFVACRAIWEKFVTHGVAPLLIWVNEDNDHLGAPPLNLHHFLNLVVPGGNGNPLSFLSRRPEKRVGPQ